MNKKALPWRLWTRINRTLLYIHVDQLILINCKIINSWHEIKKSSTVLYYFLIIKKRSLVCFYKHMKTATFFIYVVCFLFITYASNVDKKILLPPIKGGSIVERAPVHGSNFLRSYSIWNLRHIEKVRFLILGSTTSAEQLNNRVIGTTSFSVLISCKQKTTMEYYKLTYRPSRLFKITSKEFFLQPAIWTMAVYRTCFLETLRCLTNWINLMEVL